MEPTRRKFTIDDYLSRPAKACAYLHELGDDAFEEMKNYVVKHELYSVALGLYKYSPDKLQARFPIVSEYLAPLTGTGDHGFVRDFPRRGLEISGRRIR